MVSLVFMPGCQPALKADLLPLTAELTPPLHYEALHHEFLRHEISMHQGYPAPYIMPALSVAGINLRSLKMGNTGISLNSSRPATDHINGFRESKSPDTVLKSSTENGMHADQHLIQSAT